MADHSNFARRRRELSWSAFGINFDARDQCGGKEVRASIFFFDGDSRHIARGREDEIRMLDAIFPPIGHSNDEGLEWCRMQQFAHFPFHDRRPVYHSPRDYSIAVVSW